LWEKDHPENAFSKTVDTGNEWVNNDFIFHVGLPEGVMEIDQFQEVQFTASELAPLVK